MKGKTMSERRERRCECCGRLFVPRQWQTQTCSLECGRVMVRGPVKRKMLDMLLSLPPEHADRVPKEDICEDVYGEVTRERLNNLYALSRKARRNLWQVVREKHGWALATWQWELLRRVFAGNAVERYAGTVDPDSVRHWGRMQEGAA